MVLPMAAAAAARLAPKIASAGGKWMHSSNAGMRKMGSKMMGVGKKAGQDKLAKGIDKIVKNTNLSLKTLGKISRGVAKFIGFMAKHSPALKQQLTVMGKGISLMLRPIGDIMAKFLRPMSIWVMKVAQKWYSLFGTGGGDSELAKEDAVEQAEKQLEALEAGGAPAEQIAAARVNVAVAKEASSPKQEEQKTGLGILFKEMIPDAFKETLGNLGKIFKELWGIIVELGKILWEIFGPALKIIATVIGGVIMVALDALNRAFKGIATVLGRVKDVLMLFRKALEVVTFWGDKLVDFLLLVVVKSWQTIRATLKVVSDWITGTFDKIWDTLVNTIKGVYDFILDKFIGVFDKLKSAFSSVFSFIKDKIEWVKNLNPFRKDKEKAVGGYIAETGTYKLHAGERVMTAGDTSRTSEGSNFVFNVVNNITASISNDLDIKELAEKLSELNEIELRRRVSYV